MEILIFIIGLIFGSFYNVIGIRLPKKEAIAVSRSICRKCKHQLSWFENIPVFSFIFLKGRCRKCKKKISMMYPAMELLTAVLFYLVICYLVLVQISLFQLLFLVY
jgi:leader peptidase (prepilin peptidase)/N-methyltransferase